jgi:DNA anti-recombination protein RmuC
LHWFRDVEFSKQTQDIIKRLGRIATDGDKLASDFRVLGKHLTNAQGAYQEAEGRVGHLVDRVKTVIELGQKEEQQLEAPKT